jgi:hypothetical protein
MYKSNIKIISIYAAIYDEQQQYMVKQLQNSNSPLTFQHPILWNAFGHSPSTFLCRKCGKICIARK